MMMMTTTTIAGIRSRGDTVAIMWFAARTAAGGGCRMMLQMMCSGAALELMALCALLGSSSSCFVIELHEVIVQTLHLQLLGSAQYLWLLALGHRRLARVHVLQQGSDLEALHARQYDAALILRHILQYGLKVRRIGGQDDAMGLELFIVHHQGAVHIAANLVQGVQYLHQVRLMIVPAQAIGLPLADWCHRWRRLWSPHLALAETVTPALAPTATALLTVTATRLSMMMVMVMGMLLLIVSVTVVALTLPGERWLRLLVRCGVAAAVVGAVQAAVERGTQQSGRV